MRRRYATLALIALSGFIIGLILLADSGHGQWLFSRIAQIPAGDKLGHFVLFGGLSFLANLVARGTTIRLGGRVFLKWSVLLVAMATLEEASQVFFRWRSFDLLDLFAGTIGIWWFGRLAVGRLKSTSQPALDQGLGMPDSSSSKPELTGSHQASGEA